MNNEFCIIIPCRNAERWIDRCINNLLIQEYTNWTAIVINDASTDSTKTRLDFLASKHPQITVIDNTQRQYAMQNVVNAIDTHAPHDSVIGILDGDDWLSDKLALYNVNAAYKDSVDAVWTKFIYSSGRGSNLCRPLQKTPLDCDWRTSHFKTFRKSLIWGINRDLWNTSITSSYDRFLYLPILCLAKKPTFLNRVCYVYNEESSRDHKPGEQNKCAKDAMSLVREDESYRKPKNILFFVAGPRNGSREFAYKANYAYPNLASLILTVPLEIRGHKVTLFDRYLHPDSWPIQKQIDDCDVVCVTATSPYKNDAIKICKAFKGKRIIVGGAHATIKPNDFVDIATLVCCGEADNHIIKFVEQDLSGIQYAERNLDLNSIPFPYQSSFDVSTYRKDWSYSKNKNTYILNTSRGCPHCCTFCAVKTVTGHKWIGRSASVIVNDIKELQRLFGKDINIYFREDNFVYHNNRILELCQQIQNENIKVDWACEIRADAACNEDLVSLMASAGCKGFYIGFESGSQRMLDKYNKGITVEQSKKAADLAHKYGISIGASFIIGNPDETLGDKTKTEELISYIKPKVVWSNKYRELKS